MSRGRYTHVAFPVWQGVYMSLGDKRGRIPAPRSGSPAARGRAPALLETLECRCLLSASFHAPVGIAATCAGQTNLPLVAVAGATEATRAAGHIAQAQSLRPQQGVATGDPTANGTAATNSTTGAIAATDGTAPVERLTGGQFHGYDYIPPDGSAPPALPSSNLTAVPIQITKPDPKKGGNKPAKIKPSDQPGGVPASNAGPALTPLAQTPAAAGPTGAPMGAARASAGVPNPGAVISPIGPAASVARASMPLPAPSAYLGTVAVVMPAQAILAAHSVAPAGVAAISGGLAYASERAADALSLVAPGDGLTGTAAYNFVHFNPAVLLNDAIAAFTRESTSLSAVQMPARSAARAWGVTGAVVAADLLLVGYWYQKRRQRKVARASVATVQGGPIRLACRRRHAS
jgi:hypothetical protein